MHLANYSMNAIFPQKHVEEVKLHATTTIEGWVPSIKVPQCGIQNSDMKYVDHRGNDNCYISLLCNFSNLTTS